MIGGDNYPVVIDPRFFAPGRLNILIPSCWRAVRSTSANFTSRRISPGGAVGTSIKLVTLGVAFFTTSRILSATADDEIRPESITTSLDVSTWTRSLGKTS